MGRLEPKTHEFYGVVLPCSMRRRPPAAPPAGAYDGAAPKRPASPGRPHPLARRRPDFAVVSNMTSSFTKKHLVDLRFTARQLARDKGARRSHVPGGVAP
jgi:hypothetical protein